MSGYRAHDSRLNRSAAIKVSSREFNDRFEREAQAISALNHPNICTLYDIGTSPDAPGYLVMEFVDGEMLSTIIERGPLPLDKALHYAVQIVDALSAAHAKGVVHRDLKPGNIIITKNGAKVLDFGLAKLASERMPGGSSETNETMIEPITSAGQVRICGCYRWKAIVNPCSSWEPTSMSQGEPCRRMGAGWPMCPTSPAGMKSMCGLL